LPPANILFLLLFGFLLYRSRRVIGRVFIAAGFLLLYGLSISPVSFLLTEPLERNFRPVNPAETKAGVIVVLGGGTHDRSWLGLPPEPSEVSLQRTLEAVKLQRALRIPMMTAGGAGDPAQPRFSDADAMARAASLLGVPVKEIIIENKSRNTLESARAARGMLKGNRIILVTSAFHMKRSVALFRKQGFDVVPAPVGFRADHRQITFYALLPGADNLSASAFALSEYISYGWYWIKGDI
jgi:uncharacterized SAM-binding protein YcdF (DUF218 family)